jgi:hypothetical protein
MMWPAGTVALAAWAQMVSCEKALESSGIAVKSAVKRVARRRARRVTVELGSLE